MQRQYLFSFTLPYLFVCFCLYSLSLTPSLSDRPLWGAKAFAPLGAKLLVQWDVTAHRFILSQGNALWKAEVSFFIGVVVISSVYIIFVITGSIIIFTVFLAFIVVVFAFVIAAFAYQRFFA